MGKRAIRRKLESIKITTSRVLIVVFAFIGSVTWWLAEQYAGGVAANYIISPLTGFLVSSYQWGKEHPGQISMTIFFLTCAYHVIRVIQDIRPVRAIPVTVEYQSAKGESLRSATIQEMICSTGQSMWLV